MERVFGEDYELVYYLRTGQLPEPDLFGTFPALPEQTQRAKKTKANGKPVVA